MRLLKLYSKLFYDFLPPINCSKIKQCRIFEHTSGANKFFKLKVLEKRSTGPFKYLKTPLEKGNGKTQMSH